METEIAHLHYMLDVINRLNKELIEYGIDDEFTFSTDGFSYAEIKFLGEEIFHSCLDDYDDIEEGFTLEKLEAYLRKEGQKRLEECSIELDRIRLFFNQEDDDI